MKIRALLPILLLLPACTAVHYESPRFDELTRGHQKIAVLPFEMVFTGKVPRGLAPEDVRLIEEDESVAFQWSLYNRLLNRSSVHRRRPILVDLQPVEMTNRLLAENGIGIRDSWTMDTGELARLLGVDAVVRTSVTKARYLSDGASFGIAVGLDVAYEATDGLAALFLPPGLAKTHDIWADSLVERGADGRLLWKVGVHRATDWTRPANDVIAGITKKLARKFPYRG